MFASTEKQQQKMLQVSVAVCEYLHIFNYYVIIK